MKMEQKLQKDAERINVIASKFKAIKKQKEEEFKQRRLDAELQKELRQIEKEFQL